MARPRTTKHRAQPAPHLVHTLATPDRPPDLPCCPQPRGRTAASSARTCTLSKYAVVLPLFLMSTVPLTLGPAGPEPLEGLAEVMASVTSVLDGRGEGAGPGGTTLTVGEEMTAPEVSQALAKRVPGTCGV